MLACFGCDQHWVGSADSKRSTQDERRVVEGRLTMPTELACAAEIEDLRVGRAGEVVVGGEGEGRKCPLFVMNE